MLSAIRGCNINADNLQLLAPLTKKELLVYELYELYGISEKDVIDILKLQIVSPLCNK